MKKIKVIIEECISQEFVVEAENIDEAMEIAEEKYHSGEFVIDNGDVSSRSMMADDGKKQTGWNDF